MPDIELTCVACNQPFPFSESEQAFFEERGFQHPKRCRQCRQSGKRAQRPAPRDGAPRDGGPRRPSPGRGAPGRGGPPGRGGGRGGPPGRGAPRRAALAHVGGRLIYTTHCAGCGAETEVPTPVGEGRSAFCPPCFTVRGRAWLADDDE